ncbi:MAG: 3-dehydroquinate synthase, partial [Candidatus Puniceispirillum sp.]
MQRKTLTVGLGSRAYDIIIGPGLIDDAAGQLGDIAKGRHIVIVSDANVAALHLDRLKAGLALA